MYKVFIDGREGTTGLRIIDRLSGRQDIELMLIPEELRKDPNERKKYLNACDVAFLCLPDAAAIEAVSMVENENVRIIDTSTAHRTNPDWVYGFPELYDDLAKKLPTAKRVAVPGCHASGFNAIVAPLTEAGVLSHDALVTCFSLTGYSGGGKKMIAEYEGENKGDELYSARIYALTQSHKHLPEMSAISKLNNKPVFSPIVDDYYSGMLVTVPFFGSGVNGGIEAVKKAYIDKYSGKKFIDISDLNGESSAMLGSNNLSGKDKMQIFVTGNEERFTVSARFDNLGKGASGAAVQCMNIMLGFDEDEGLDL